MRRMAVVLAGMAVLMMVAAPAFAHDVIVTNPNSGEVVTQQWIGGGILPEPAQEAPPMFGPFRLPPSHGTGLVSACHATESNDVVSMPAPPYFTGCQHGLP